MAAVPLTFFFSAAGWADSEFGRVAVVFNCPSSWARVANGRAVAAVRKTAMTAKKALQIDFVFISGPPVCCCFL